MRSQFLNGIILDSMPASYEREMKPLYFHSFFKTHRHCINTHQSVMNSFLSQFHSSVFKSYRHRLNKAQIASLKSNEASLRTDFLSLQKLLTAMLLQKKSIMQVLAANSNDNFYCKNCL